MKDIEGYEGLYAITEDGRVWSYEKIRPQKGKMIARFLNPVTSGKTGYLQIVLRKNFQKKKYYVHRLVASAFILNPENKREVNHKNGVKTDNRLENLEWMTSSENVRHSFLIGLRSLQGENHSQVKLTVGDVYKIRLLRDKRKLTYVQIAKMFDITPQHAGKIAKREKWTCVV